jgi:hypothetical protein
MNATMVTKAHFAELQVAFLRLPEICGDSASPVSLIGKSKENQNYHLVTVCLCACPILCH